MPKRLGVRKLSNPVSNIETPTVNTENTSWTMPGYEKTAFGSEQVKLYNPNDFLHPQPSEPSLQQQQHQQQSNHLQQNYGEWNMSAVTSQPSTNIHPPSSMDNEWSWPHDVHNGQTDPWSWNTSSSSSPATGSNTQLEWNNSDFSIESREAHGDAGHSMWNPTVGNQLSNSVLLHSGSDQSKNPSSLINTSTTTMTTTTTTITQQFHPMQQGTEQIQQHQSWEYNSYAAQQPYIDVLNVHQTIWQPTSTSYQWTNQQQMPAPVTSANMEYLNKSEQESNVESNANPQITYSQSNMQTSTSLSNTCQVYEPTVMTSQESVIENYTNEASNEESVKISDNLQFTPSKSNSDSLQVQTTLSASHPHLFHRTDSWLSGSSLQTFHNSLSGSQDLLDASYFMPPEAVEAVRQHMASLSVKSESNDNESDQKSSELPSQLAPTEVDFAARNEEIPKEGLESVCNLSPPNKQENSNVDCPVTEDGDAQAVLMNTIPDAIEGIEDVALQSQLSCNNETIRQPPDGAAAIRPLNVATGRANLQAATAISTPISTTVNVPSLGSDGKLSEKSVDRNLPDSENVENPKLPMKSSSSTGKPETYPHHLNVYGGLIGHREGSPFKPLVKSAASIPSIIQHELPDNHSLHPQNPSKFPDHGANLEMTPDNVERPSDLDHTNPELDKEFKEKVSLSQETHTRNRRDLNNDSPSTTLWNNPEPKQANIFLLPAATNSPINQKVLIVPSLSDQQEILDNPLGKNTPSENNSSENVEDVSSVMKINSNDEQCFKETLYESSVSSTSQNNLNRTTSTPVSATHVQNDNLASAEQDKSKLKLYSNLEDSLQQEINVNSSQIAANVQSLSTNKNQQESSRLADITSGIPNRGQRPPVPGLGPVQPPRALSEPPGTQSSGTQLVNNYEGKESESVQRKQDEYPYQPKETDERYDRLRNTDYNRERYRPLENYSDQRHLPQYYDDPQRKENRDKRKDNGKERDRYYERDDAYRYRDDRYREDRYRDDRYFAAERDRSRPSSRGSVDYEYDRHYQANRGRDAYPDDMHRGGYDSDRENDYYRNYNYSSYDQYRQDPRYYKDYDYSRYERDKYYQRYYADPYYGYNNYNYGYYDEMYRNDPVFRAQYEAQYRDYYARQGYDSSDRRSVQSGRSSVNDEIQRDRNKSQNYLHNSSHLSNSANSAYEQAVYPDYSQKENFSQQYEPPASNKRLTPVKFHMPHMRVQFTSTGQLVKVLPNNPNEGQPATVEIHDLQILFSGSSEVEELKNFPGPLERSLTHKNDVIQFCCDKIKKAKDDVSLHDRDSVILMWELLILLIRQNGSVVGTDIAELLLKDHECLTEDPLGSNNASADNLSKEETVASDASFAVLKDCSTINKSSEEKITQKFREYLLFGNKKEALEKAMKNGLWGHALFLASKMDARTHANVMTRFANSLKLNDPLQTLYQLMSGRQPAAVTCVAEEKWGDWRPHLAMILSNTSSRPELDRKSIMILGDTLATRGCLHAAQFCYLMAQVEFGTYSSKTSKLVLLGSNHSLPFNEFITTEAIQCTEIYEYALSLANPNFVLPHFQSYRFIYATRLAEYGLSQEALHYCEIISSHINKNPSLFHPDLVIQLYELANKLKYFDPCYTNNEGEISELEDPQWLQQLRNSIHSYSNVGMIQDVSSVNSSYLAENLAVDNSGLYMQQQPNVSSEGFYDPNEMAQTEASYSHEQLDQQSSMIHQNSYSHYGTQSLTESQNVYSPNQQEFQQTQLENTTSYNEMMYANDSQINYSYYNQPENSTFIPSQDPSNNFNSNQVQETFSQNQVSSEDYWDMSTKMASSSPSASSATTEFKNTSTHLNRRASSSSNRSHTDKSEEKKETKTKQSGGNNGGWLGGIFNKFMPKPKNQMKLPDDRNPTIIWDSKLNRWVNTEEDDEETNPVATHPPMDSEILKGLSQTNKENIKPIAASGDFNKFRRSAVKGPKQRYVDVVSKGMTTSVSNVVPQNLLPTVDSPLISPSQLLIPTTSVPGNETEASHYNPLGQPEVTAVGSRSNSPLQRSENERNELSRCSSQSSLAREVQHYMAPSVDEPQVPVPAAPVMFNPMQMPLPASQTRTSRIGRNRYPH